MAVVSVLAALAMSQGQAAAAPNTAAPEWKTIHTKIGATLSLPADMPLMYSIVDSPSKTPEGTSALTTIGSEAYCSQARKCWVTLTQSPIAKDEDPDDSEATRLEDVVYKEIDLESDKVTSISYSAQGGWPTVDLDVAPSAGSKITAGGLSIDVTPDIGVVHYRVCRSKTKNYELSIYGSLGKEDRQKILDSMLLPKEAGDGELKSWGPESKEQELADGHVKVWSPIKFVDEADDPDAENDPGTKSFQAEFGYVSLEISVMDLPSGEGAKLDASALDQLLKTQSTAAAGEDDPQTVKYSDVEGYTSNLDAFRYLTYRDETLDGRVDVALKGDKVYLFYISVPHGMLESEDIKRFIASYSLR